MNIKLKNAILQSGEPQYKVAAATQLHETRLSRIIQERATPTADEAASLAHYFGVSESELFDTPELGGES